MGCGLVFTPKIIKTLNELELAVYQYVIKNKEKVIYMRIRDLADATHVSTTTILRFCKKLNCDGFSEFKTMLKLHLKEDKVQELSFKNGHDVMNDFCIQLQNGELDKHIQKSADIISTTKNIIFMGTGSSGILAEYAARLFSGFSIFASHIGDPFFPIRNNIGNSIPENSIFIVLSVSGENHHILENLNLLKSEAVQVISITNTRMNSIAKISDYNIAYYTVEEIYPNTDVQITTQIPVLYILEQLSREIHRRLSVRNHHILNQDSARAEKWD